VTSSPEFEAGGRTLPNHAGVDVSAPEQSPDRDDAVGTLFDAHYRHLLAVARRLLDDPADAEDIVMDAFVGLYRRWGAVQRTDNVYLYLRASVVNGSRNRLRRLRLAGLRLFTQLEPPASPADQTAMLHFEHEEVIRALRTLSRRQREVLVLRYFDQQSEAEIAIILGCSAGSVKTHASRGLRALAEAMGEH
jgi:RNA polymerase sigma-70 factor (sigma-E family)